MKPISLHFSVTVDIQYHEVLHKLACVCLFFYVFHISWFSFLFHFSFRLEVFIFWAAGPFIEKIYCVKVLYECLQPLMSSKGIKVDQWTLFVQKYLDYQDKNVKYKSSTKKSVIKIMIWMKKVLTPPQLHLIKTFLS